MLGIRTCFRLIEEMQDAIRWCNKEIEMLRNPASVNKKIEELKGYIIQHKNTITMAKLNIQLLEEEEVKKLMTAEQALESKRKVEQWMREQYPGIAGARE